MKWTKRPLNESADFSIDRIDASKRAARKADSALGPVSAKNVLEWVIEREAREDRAECALAGLTSVRNYSGVKGLSGFTAQRLTQSVSPVGLRCDTRYRTGWNWGPSDGIEGLCAEPREQRPSRAGVG